VATTIQCVASGRPTLGVILGLVPSIC